MEHAKEFKLVDDFAPPTRVLTAYQVGENDIVAAYDPAGALALLCEYCGWPDGFLTLEDVEPVSDQVLDALQVFDQDEGKTITLDRSLRENVAALTEPQYMYGWE